METEITYRSSMLDQLRDRLRVLEITGRNPAEIELCRAQIRILEAGGMALIPRLQRNGRDTGAVLLHGRFGPVWKTPGGDWVKDKPSAIRRAGMKRAMSSVTAWARLDRLGRVEIYACARNMAGVEVTESRLAALG